MISVFVKYLQIYICHWNENKCVMPIFTLYQGILPLKNFHSWPTDFYAINLIFTLESHYWTNNLKIPTSYNTVYTAQSSFYITSSLSHQNPCIMGIPIISHFTDEEVETWRDQIIC